MSWLSVGTLSPSHQWQQFESPVIGGELFRVTQTWQGEYPGAGPAWLSSVYADAGIAGFRRFYSNDDQLLIEMPNPQEFIDAGLLVRYIQLRLGIQTRLYADANWQITLELWTDDTDPTGAPAQLISGGTYGDP